MSVGPEGESSATLQPGPPDGLPRTTQTYAQRNWTRPPYFDCLFVLKKKYLLMTIDNLFLPAKPPHPRPENMQERLFGQISVFTGSHASLRDVVNGRKASESRNPSIIINLSLSAECGPCVKPRLAPRNPAIQPRCGAGLTLDTSQGRNQGRVGGQDHFVL